MSFCGAADRYPDARDMGYPFARPGGDSRSYGADQPLRQGWSSPDRLGKARGELGPVVPVRAYP
jgi:hypothetical protein